MVEQRTKEENLESLTLISNFLETIKDSPVYEKAMKFLEAEKARNESFKMNAGDSNFARVVFMGAPESDIKTETWDTIYKAMQDNSCLMLQYVREGCKKSSAYNVQPFQLIFDNGIWDLWAYSFKPNYEGMRLFNLSRIEKVRVLGTVKKFTLPSDYDFMHTMSGNFGCYNDFVPRRYKIRFAKDSYAWLYSKDRIWGDNQIIEETDEGFCLIFEATQFKPVLRWVLGWGDEVVPLEPAELISEWQKKVKKMAASVC